MTTSEPTADLAKAFAELSRALFELRDAFVEISLALKDWQFENDSARRHDAEQTTHQLLQHIASPGGPPV